MGAIGKYTNGAYVEFASTGGDNTGDIEPNKAIVSNENGVIISSSVTDVEIEALSGVKSNLQAQIDALEGKPAPTPIEYSGAVTTILNDNLTADKVLISDENGKVSASAVTKTQLGYLDGLTGNVQEQINYLMENAGSGGTPLPAVTALEASGKRGSAELKWTDPEDVVFNGETLAQFDGTKVVRNTEHYPTSTDDGVVAVDSKVRNQYAETPFVDESLENDRDYYYTLFPYTAKNIYTFSDKNKVIARPLDFDPVLANNTWEDIALASESGVAKNIWSYGDEKDGCVIIGFDHDDIVVEAGQQSKKSGITFMVNNGINTRWYNGSANSFCNYINSVPFSTINSIMSNGGTYNNIEYVTKECFKHIKEVKKYTYKSNTLESVTEIHVKGFLFSAAEMQTENRSEGEWGYTDGKLYEGFNFLKMPSQDIYLRSFSRLISNSKWYVWYIQTDATGKQNLYGSERSSSHDFVFGFCI